MFSLIRAFYDIFLKKRPEGYEQPSNVKHYTLTVEKLNNYSGTYKCINFYPTNAHNDLDFDKMILYLGHKFLKECLCLVEITALGWNAESKENDDWWKEEFPYEHYKFLKKYNLDNDIFYNGTDKIAYLKNGLDIYFTDKFFNFNHGFDISDHTLHIYVPVIENKSVYSYEDINNIKNSKKFKLSVEVDRHGSYLILIYNEDEIRKQEIISAFSEVCLKFDKELDVRIDI